jgi:flagellar biosynthesis protein FliQ
VNEGVVLGLARESMWVAFQVGAPILLVSLVVGVVVSIVQAATQVNEATLAYVPKMVAVFVAILVLGPWMMETMLSFSSGLFANMGQYGR